MMRTIEFEYNEQRTSESNASSLNRQFRIDRLYLLNTESRKIKREKGCDKGGRG
jgi:hypothetical protein